MLSKQLLWACSMVLALCLGTAPLRAETIQVTIDKMEFSPAQIDVKVGDTIEWVNNDILAHTATAKGGWDVVIPPKKSASMVVRAAGSVDYYCRFHPNMMGRITVSAP
ncbi:plastocyanin [Mesorhizobium soli]|uniref:cupredoxin domain-containing protein n=1 Tax=Pseudaminobacter soli (ex Li et al. 2025) TaxID=1295366 RepID=UPI0024738AA8|nr:cupredoxin family copper-binding protein [Mesorhizobium soli]MDH6233163.1 plastocyanin [Mesorhizobium soli]